MYALLLGADYASLPAVLRGIHDRQGSSRYRGVATVMRGQSWLAQLCAAVTHLPPTRAQAPIEVEIQADAVAEKWTRFFGTHTMHSRLRAHGLFLREHLGLLRFDFVLCANNGAIVWTVASVRALGIPLPERWFSGVSAREFEQDGRYGFDVRAQLPLAGLIVHYFGTLDVD